VPYVSVASVSPPPSLLLPLPVSLLYAHSLGLYALQDLIPGVDPAAREVRAPRRRAAVSLPDGSVVERDAACPISTR
jgi:hypothetical protein